MGKQLQFDVEGLWQEWDALDTIRADIRAGKFLTRPIDGKDSTLAQCTQHSEVLKPCLVRMMGCNLKLPDIEPMRSAVETFYQQSSKEVPTARVDDDAWEIRKMLRLVKRKASRGDVSLDACFSFYVKDFFWGGHFLGGASVHTLSI